MIPTTSRVTVIPPTNPTTVVATGSTVLMRRVDSTCIVGNSKMLTIAIISSELPWFCEVEYVLPDDITVVGWGSSVPVIVTVVGWGSSVPVIVTVVGWGSSVPVVVTVVGWGSTVPVVDFTGYNKVVCTCECFTHLRSEIQRVLGHLSKLSEQ